MLLIIIFSFNRAIQLDLLLKSIITRFKLPDYKITIIYHATGKHDVGYKKIISKYEKFLNISFLEREKRICNINSYCHTFYSLKNIIRFFAHSYLLNRNSDNFKSLLENSLKTTDCEYVMFNTDDGYYYDDVIISDKIFSMIKAKPLYTSYRLYVGENLDEFPDYIRRENEYYIWNYYDSIPITHWTYPFAVDGTVYYTRSILDIIEKVPYHNPITLEGYVVNFVKEKKLLKVGISPIKSSLVCTKLNRVSTSSFNPTINISPDFLNGKYLDGYELELEVPSKITNANIVPEKIFLIKENQKLLIYTLELFGKRVQDALGIEGAKYQVKDDV
jgi:hypothetical protein